jgi:hypothetical protein
MKLLPGTPPPATVVPKVVVSLPVLRLALVKPVSTRLVLALLGSEKPKSTPVNARDAAGFSQLNQPLHSVTVVGLSGFSSHGSITV